MTEENKETKMSATENIEKGFKMLGLRPRICHNQEAKLTLAWTIAESAGVKGGGHLDLNFAFFFCGPRDSWIRARGYAGALTRLHRRPTSLTITAKKALTHEDFAYIGNILVEFVQNISKNRQVKTLAIELKQALEARGILVS
jgi:hypothetical protein